MQLTLALGANLGDRRKTLATARQLIREQIGPEIAATSLHETKAWGHKEQPDFLNQVMVVAIQQPALLQLAAAGKVPQLLHQVLDRTQHIESLLGRQRHEHWGPRTCDIDLIFVGDLRFEDHRISLPHPWWSERDFVGGIIRRELPWLLVP